VAYPVIKQVFETQGHQYENILVPVTDGKRMYNIPVSLEVAYNSEGKELVRAFEKAIMLHTIDEAWKDNLRALDDLKQSVQNASYEQKDPLLIYKLESFNLFKAMVEDINQKITAVLMRAQIPVRQPEQVRQATAERRSDYSKYRTQKADYRSGNDDVMRQDTRERQVTQPIRAEKTVGRNDPCPCGSGKKYKNCCGR
jgi:preprotein translocase subunit SecA